MCKINNDVEEAKDKLLNVTDRPQSSKEVKPKIN
jgi:hypothetical protein